MKVYVAGRTGSVAAVNAMQETLRTAGHQITFDWTGPEGEIRGDWTEHTVQGRAIATREKEAVAMADAVVLIGEGLGEGEGGLGCFIEVGMAMAAGTLVLVVGPARESVFWCGDNVARVDTAEDALLVLNSADAKPRTDEPGLLAEARGQINDLRRIAWECAENAGADLSGYDSPDHLVFDPESAVAAVASMRRDYEDDLPTLACKLVQRVPVGEQGGKAQLIAEAALGGDASTLEDFDQTLPENDDQDAAAEPAAGA